MGPVAMLRPSPGASSQTQPDGRPVYGTVKILSQIDRGGLGPALL